MIEHVLLLCGVFWILISVITDIRNHSRMISQILRKMEPKHRKKLIFVKPRENNEYTCPNCGQPCSREEYERGYCLDCDQIEFFDDFELEEN